jgi:hypothetical protein
MHICVIPLLMSYVSYGGEITLKLTMPSTAAVAHLSCRLARLVAPA